MWQRYIIPPGTTVINWIIDFNERVKQLHTISQASQQGGAAALKVLLFTVYIYIAQFWFRLFITSFECCL